MVHPVAGATLASAEEEHALDFEFLADECVEIDAGSQDVAAQVRGATFAQVQGLAQLGKYLFSEERYLTFVVLFVIEEAISADSATRDTLDLIDFTCGMLPRRFAVMAEILVARRNEEAAQLHGVKLGQTNKRRQPQKGTVGRRLHGSVVGMSGPA